MKAAHSDSPPEPAKLPRPAAPLGSSRPSALDSAAARLTPAERAERGKAVRSAVPRHSHAV